MMFIEKYKRDTRGNTAMIMALCIMPIILMLGLALDLTRVTSSKSRIQACIDAAIIAATKDIANAAMTDAEVRSLAQNYFDAEVAELGLGAICQAPEINLDRATYTIDMNVDCNIPTTIGGLVGITDVDFAAAGEAKIQVTKLDLALMLDVSGSMAGTKLDALKASANSAIDELITPETGNRVRIALAPYAESVNVGSRGWDVFGPGYSTESCASERAGVEAYTGKRPGAGAYIGTLATTCPTAEIISLTSNTTTLKNAISGLAAGGGTAGHVGAAWAWYLIEPDWLNIWPASSKPLAYEADDGIKAVILMTDGAFNTTYEAGMGSSDDQATAMCDAMKAEGVLVFAVAFQAPAAGEAILQTCASGTDMYFNATSTAELQEAYKSIASSLSGLRVSK